MNFDHKSKMLQGICQNPKELTLTGKEKDKQVAKTDLEKDSPKSIRISRDS